MAPSTRASNRVAVAIAATLLTVFTAKLSAHRLDEYLQAARIEIAVDRIRVELDLTPGVAVADTVVREIDADRDGVLSSNEQRAYALRVLSGIELAVDGEPVLTRLVASRFPELDAVDRGQGTISLDLDAAVPTLAGGAHRLSFRNRNDPDSAAYLANALVPQDDRLSIGRQTRDPLQRELTLDVVVQGSPSWSALESVLLTLAGAVVVVVVPLTRRATTRCARGTN